MIKGKPPPHLTFDYESPTFPPPTTGPTAGGRRQNSPPPSLLESQRRRLRPKPPHSFMALALVKGGGLLSYTYYVEYCAPN